MRIHAHRVVLRHLERVTMGEKKASFRGQVVRRPLRKGKIAGSNPVESIGYFLLSMNRMSEYEPLNSISCYSMYQMS